MSNQKKKNSIYWVAFGGCAIIAVIAFFLVLVLSNGKETHYVTETPPEDMTVIICDGTASLKNNFFEDTGAMNYSDKIKILFDNDNLDSINYTFSGSFNSEKSATDASSEMHAKYNTHMSETNVDQEALYPTFTVDGTNLLVNFSITNKDLNSKTAELVFIDNDQFKKLKNASVDTVKNIYKQNGFDCKTSK